MLVYVDNKIIESEICEEIKSNYDYNRQGYYFGAVWYLAPDGTKFYINESKFSNVLDGVGTDENGYNETSSFFSFDALSQDPENEYRLEEIESEIMDLYEEQETCEDDDEYGDIENEINSLKEEKKEKEEEQEYYNELIPSDVTLILEISNIGMGASSSQDFNFDGYEIYKDGNSFYVQSKSYEYTYQGSISSSELESFLIWSWEKYGYESSLQFIVDNKELFDIETII